MFNVFRLGLEKYLPARIEAYAERKVKRHAALHGYLEYYKRKSPSTGCSYSDYLVLYNYVKNHKPREILECGTGFSTLVLMQALKENEEEFGIKGHLVSMEESEYYHNMALNSLPPDLKNDHRLQILHSPAVEDSYEFFHGVRYKDVPKRPYDFVYTDGPDLMIGPDKKIRTFNLDFIKLVSESNKSIGAIVDTRKRTCLMYSLLFGSKFYYDYLRYVGIVDSVNKRDLADGKKIATEATALGILPWPNILRLIKGDY